MLPYRSIKQYLPVGKKVFGDFILLKNPQPKLRAKEKGRKRKAVVQVSISRNLGILQGLLRLSMHRLLQIYLPRLVLRNNRRLSYMPGGGV